MGVKEYKLPNGRKAVFEYDEYGVGRITLEALDVLMGMVNIDLVRCGECSWYEKPSCRWHNIDNKPTDFCSYGERRAE